MHERHSSWSFLWRARYVPGWIRDRVLDGALAPIRCVFAKHERLRRIAAWMRLHRRRLTAVFVLVAHLLGAAASLNVLTEQRTPQGAIAWIVSLNTFPYLAVPLYWTIGETHYETYSTAYRASVSEGDPIIKHLYQSLKTADLIAPASDGTRQVLTRLVKLPVTRGNAAKLLIDGRQTFDAMMVEIDAAESYVLLESYIIRDDWLGRELKNLLVKKAQQGVRVMVLYDEYGSRDLPSSYLSDLTENGVLVHGFNSPLADGSTTRINFRNHRKLLIVDGVSAFVGGLNIGDEYRYGVDELGLYRDTHVIVHGPLVQCSQVAFVEDWHAVTGEMLENLRWTPVAAKATGGEGLCVPTGPADEFDTALMFFMQLVQSSEQRVWIATPYFVPDEQMVTTLKLASLRGVDVRIMIPKHSDSTLAWLSSFSYLSELDAAGVKVYRYEPRFVHQKVILVDDSVAAVGTANFDNRSFRLNFELMLAMFDCDFISDVERMLEDDFLECRRVEGDDLQKRNLGFQLLVRASRLLAPIQ
ncbi:cardiolipin synthase [Stieleria maiorica]